MITITTCGACHAEITQCLECGGKICTKDCPDRVQDGCICGENAVAAEEPPEE